MLSADVILLATGAQPRVLPGAEPDGVRVLDWRQLYDLPSLPEHLIVVGSGVTGAEFAGAYLAMGCQVTLVSSRERVLPSEDPDAAEQLQQVFTRRGMHILRGRAASVDRSDDGVVVHLVDGVVGQRVALPDDGRLDARTLRASGWLRSASSATRAATSRSTGCRARPTTASTPQATSPVC